MSDRDAAPCPLPHALDPDRPRTPDHGLRICRGHARALPERIRQLAELHDELGADLCAPELHREPVSGTKGAVGLNLNPVVANLRAAIHDSLAGWCRIVCEERDIHPPETDDVPALVEFLIRWSTWLASQDFIAELWAELIHDPVADTVRGRSLAQKASSVVTPSGTRKAKFDSTEVITLPSATVRMACPECGSELTGWVRDDRDPRASDVTCEGCAKTWTPEQFRHLGRKLKGADVEATRRHLVKKHANP